MRMRISRWRLNDGLNVLYVTCDINEYWIDTECASKTIVPKDWPSGPCMPIRFPDKLGKKAYLFSRTYIQESEHDKMMLRK